MRILFINPPLGNFIEAETPRFVTTERGISPPLGLIQIATCLNQSRHIAEVMDAYLDGMSFDDVAKEIQKRRPDIIAMSAFTFNLIDTLRVAEIAKTVDPLINVVLGGAHATMFPYETIKQKYVDIVVVGEGELAFGEMLSQISNGNDLSSVKGLFFKDKDGSIINTGQRSLINELDILPIPDRTLTDYKKYYSVLSKQNPLTIAVTSRGCSYRCTFCDRPQAGGKSWRARSPAMVADEMEICAGLGIKEILFYDDTWTMDMKRAEDICMEIIKRGINISWSIRTRVDKINAKLISLMKKAGCQRINFGVESGTERGLGIIKKEISLEQVKNAFSLCKRAGIESLAYFMFGLPNETREDMEQTIRFARQIKPDFCHFTVFTPFPSTVVWNDLIAKGNMTIANAWKDYAENPTMSFSPPTCNEYLNKNELFEMCNSAYSAFYIRPGYVFRELLRLRSFREFARKAIAGYNLIFASSTK